MPRPSKSVYKFNSKGKLISSFESVTDAVTKEGIEYNLLYNRIAKGQPCSEYWYSYSPNFKPPKMVKEKVIKPTLFDIIAWQKLMKY